MSGLSRNVDIIILGQKYVVKSDQDEGHLQEVARYVDARLSELTRGGRLANTGALVIGALNIANEYFLYRRKMESMLGELEQRSDRALALLEAQVSGEPPR